MQITRVTTFAWTSRRDDVYVCAAQADELCVSLLKYSSKDATFRIKRVRNQLKLDPVV